MTTNVVRRLVAGTVAGAAVVASVAVTSTTAHATLPGTNGKIAYSGATSTSVTNADGSTVSTLLNAGTDAGWSPDGSRIAYTAQTGIGSDAGIWTTRADGSNPIHVTNRGDEHQGDKTHPVWTPDGSRIIFSDLGYINFVGSDGGWWSGVLVDHPANTYADVSPSVSKKNIVAFERLQSGVSLGLYQYDLTAPSKPATLLLSNASQPDFSPDGTKIAFTRPDPTTNLPQIWTAKADGTGATQLTTDGPWGATQPTWSPDGNTILYIQPRNTDGSGPVERLDPTNKTSTPTNRSGVRVSWQPIRQNYVDRVWGQDGTDTAIAASQWNYSNAGQTDPNRVPAKAVVLTRSDTYLDALAGSALAINRQAPLLITARSGLEPRVEAEIKRVLGTSGTVYLIGGTYAMPQPIEDRLKSIGFTVKRIWGNSYFDTAIAIDKVLAPHPATAIVATGAQYYDALAAGAAAGWNSATPGAPGNSGTVIVLTDGDTMPPESAAYLNTLNPNYDPNTNTGTTIVGGGGPGARALVGAYQRGQLPSWPDNISYYSLIGQYEKDTALMLARFFFAAPHVAAVATTRGWQDALTGGAMIGFNGGPLLLTDTASNLYGPLATYLSQNSGGMWDTVIVGGYIQMPDSLINQLGNAISLPTQFTYTSYQPGKPPASAGALRAQSTPTPQTTSNRTADERPAAAPPGATRTTPTTITR